MIRDYTIGFMTFIFTALPISDMMAKVPQVSLLSTLQYALYNWV